MTSATRGAIAGCVALTIALGADLAVAREALTLPDRAITPGAVSPDPSAVVCRYGYARSRRPRYDHAWRRFRVSVFRAYRIPHEDWRSYTLDHLVPLELGGAPMDLRNVWPEPKTEARRKDAVEDALHAAVCYDRTVPLDAAQSAIARDWTRTPVGIPTARRAPED